MPFNPQEFIKAFEDAVKRKREGGIICPMCSNKQWNLPGGYTLSPLQNELAGFQLGGPAIPTVPIICANCGFVAEIAIGVLGMLPKQAETPKQQDAIKGDSTSEKTP